MVAFAAFMALTLLYSLGAGSGDSDQLFFGFAATLFAGVMLMLLGHGKRAFSLDRRQGFLMTALAWIVLPGFGALPLVAHGLSFPDAYFESVSAMTTTGSTVMAGLDQTPHGILLWRSMMAWFGGVGIIVLGIIILPFLRVAGMQLFHTESSDTSEKIVGKTFHLALWIVGVYVVLTFLSTVAFRVFGMTWFDAFIHATGSLATGGMSSHDASFGFFDSRAILIVGIVSMIAGGMPFVAFIRAAKGTPLALIRDIQVRAFVGFLAIASLILAIDRTLRQATPFDESLIHAAFNVTSVVTTTGFASTDYQLWGPFAIGAFFMLTFVGGCSGSTAGGIKIYRFQILVRLMLAHLKRVISPNRVQVVLYSERKVEDEVAFAILAFLTVMLVCNVISTLALTALGLDFVTAISASATSWANVGPGLGPIIGPAGNFQPLPNAAMWILSAMMILGRLEFFTILVLLTPSFWRH